ncbi:MAG: tyrosine-type recombinase/integrase [Akkermansia sp.]|nr:tyrosine-type recombinase/integrase [Akkermansia sp.]MBR2314722.1 tyrosine-type recombinase/integrase [Akkermansia sp.]
MNTSSHLTSSAVTLPLPEAPAQILVKLTEDAAHENQEFFQQLRRVVKAIAKALEDSEETVSFREAADFSILARTHRRPSTLADLRSYINRMCLYPGFAEMPIRFISIPKCRVMLQAQFGHSAHSFRKAQTVLHSVFTQAIRQGWCTQNPAKAILRPQVEEKRIEILNLKQIRSLLHACRHDIRLLPMEAPLRLMLWCGIRPMEVRRLHWSDIDPSERLVYIESFNSKTGGARAVPLRGGARCLLRQMKAPDQRIAPCNWERLWLLLRQRAGFRTWQNDVLRHTFASMHLKRYHNLPLLQEEMGHRNAILLQTRYLNLRYLRNADAHAFFKTDNWL